MKKTPAADLTLRFTGNCQLCDHDQKCRDEKLVHHGFKRPEGLGHIVGDCPGVGELPYEKSCDLIKARLAGARQVLASLELYARKLARAAATDPGPDTEGLGEILVQTVYKKNWTTRKVETIELRLCVTNPYVWEEELRHQTYENKREIERYGFLIRHCERRIAEWTLLPLREGWEEKVKADKKIVADAKREARLEKKRVENEKKAERKAKAAERDAKREALKAEIAAKFQAFAADPTPENKLAARKYAAKIASTKAATQKFGYVHISDLKVDDELLKLDLASPPTAGYRLPHYFFQFSY